MPWPAAPAAGATVEVVKVEAGQTDFDAALATLPVPTP